MVISIPKERVDEIEARLEFKISDFRSQALPWDQSTISLICSLAFLEKAIASFKALTKTSALDEFCSG